MNETLSRDQVCTQSCSAPCASHPSRVSLSEALERFEREACRSFCDTGRYRAACWSWGEGPPLLLLHGLADDSRAFTLLAALLSRSFRCVAYDLPTGRGDGARLRRHTHTDLVADLWAILDHCGVKQAYAFASSFGSTLALEAMRDRPQRIPRAILQAAVAHKPLTRTERVCAWLMSHCPGAMTALPLRKYVMTQLHHGPFAGTREEEWTYSLGYSGTLPIRTVGRQARMLHHVDLRPALGTIRQPMLLIQGDRDPVVKEAATQELLEKLPSAGRVMIEGAGHVPSLSHPEALAHLIRAFLTPPDPSGKMHIADCQSCEQHR